MHILVLPSWYPNKNNNLSGIFFKEQAEGLAKQKNIQIGCIAINESSPKYLFNKNKFIFDYYDENINNVNTVGVLYPIANRLKWLRTIIRKIVFSILFKKYIKKYGKPDLVHLHSFLYGDLALWIKEKYNINYVLTEHSSGFARRIYNRKEMIYAKKIFLNSKYNICVSSEFKILLENEFNIKFSYIPNLIDMDFFLPKSKELIKKDGFHFINIGFLDKKKNQSMLIEAFFQSFGENKNIRLTIVGSGPEYVKLKKLIIALNIEEQIKLYGRASRDEIKQLLQKSDAFVLSSQYETFGVVVIEAMACGLPVVATKCGGPESILQDIKIGILSEINKNDIAEKMKQLYSNRNNYDSNYIRGYVTNNFSEEIICKKLLEIYNAVIK